MTLAANPPIEIPLETLTPKQKWQIVEFLCEDLSSNHADEIVPPAWHADVLREREERDVRGEAIWQDLDEAFASIRQRVS